ncbi:MAG TPA: isoprenylcysteine carboxylmethyltransferase family protein [Candidatus Eremiobacteraceae bacterium]|nr:isoprenylcysteine carboxylmethyltransferase family protein [Candidatus Eremiobacteraceae bacterium]
MASDSAGVRVPPPFIYFGALLLGIFGGRFLPGTLPNSLATVIAGSVLFMFGFALAYGAISCFRERGTNVNPNAPVTALVFDGPYRITRNPMYVGLACAYAAIALWTRSLWALVLLVPVLLVIRYAVIAREERYLTAKFGAEYAGYTARVRRWI